MRSRFLPLLVLLTFTFSPTPAARAQEPGDTPEKVDSAACVTCHEEGKDKVKIQEKLGRSAHQQIGCLDCHQDKDTVPHRQGEDRFVAGLQGCGACHAAEAEEYKAHGRAALGTGRRPAEVQQLPRGPRRPALRRDLVQNPPREPPPDLRKLPREPRVICIIICSV